jgi:FkbM family methyltransferase
MLNRILSGVIMQGAYGRLFYLLSYDDLLHIDQGFEETIKEWFDISRGAFIDVGANIGRYTVGLAENFNQVYAFEPVRETFLTLEKNIHLNGLENVMAMQIGLWNCSVEKEISIGMHKGLSSIVISLPNSQTQKIVVDACDNIAESLDIRDVSLVKIDAEGAEVEIISGMEKLLLRDSPRVIVEVKSMNRKKVNDMLDHLGYTLIEIQGENHLFEII